MKLCNLFGSATDLTFLEKESELLPLDLSSSLDDELDDDDVVDDDDDNNDWGEEESDDDSDVFVEVCLEVEVPRVIQEAECRTDTARVVMEEEPSVGVSSPWVGPGATEVHGIFECCKLKLSLKRISNCCHYFNGKKS